MSGERTGAQEAPTGDVAADEVADALARVSSMIHTYLATVGERRVLPAVTPGELRASLPTSPPLHGEPLSRILDDYESLVMPAVTHWNHPGFFGYFAISGSAPGILAEALTAALNVNAMLWRTGPAATELEEVTCDWLRQMMALPPELAGHINDTASTSTLLALAAARDRALGPALRQRGLAGSGFPTLTVYAAEHAHSSVDKAALTLGLGLENVRRVASDGVFRMDPGALRQAIVNDRAAGRRPIAVVGTAGSTSTTSVDPLPALAEVCRAEDLWLHVDAAYGGAAAICPEYRPLLNGIEAADSIVVNPHKWLFTPVDCSVLFVRDVEALHRAFRVVPDYLVTPERDVTNLMDHGFQLGRRFRALKLWFVFRAFGVEGLRERIRAHCAWAAEFADWVRAEEGFELAAPVPFSTVCFRATPAGPEEERDRFNELLLERVNAAGPVFLSHTKLNGRFVLRLAIGNLRTERRHVQGAWRLLRDEAAGLRASSG